MGTLVAKWGPMWLQCINISTENSTFAKQSFCYKFRIHLAAALNFFATTSNSKVITRLLHILVWCWLILTIYLFMFCTRLLAIKFVSQYFYWQQLILAFLARYLTLSPSRYVFRLALYSVRHTYVRWCDWKLEPLEMIFIPPSRSWVEPGNQSQRRVLTIHGASGRLPELLACAPHVLSSEI